MDPALLIILLFIVAPLLEKILKAGKTKPPEDGQRPRRPPRPLPDRHPSDARSRFPPSGERVELPRPGAQRRRPRPGRSEEDDAAAVMLPDDLWEILTGERRAPPPTRPPADEEYLPEEAIPDEVLAWETPVADEELADEEQADPARQEWYESRPLPAPARAQSIPVRAAPEIVSLEKLTYDAETRHDAFHAKVDAFVGPAKVRRRRPSRFAAELESREDLRRAVILAEVLGTPKGLE